jgi:hypothetical protein
MSYKKSINSLQIKVEIIPEQKILEVCMKLKVLTNDVSPNASHEIRQLKIVQIRNVLTTINASVLNDKRLCLSSMRFVSIKPHSTHEKRSENFPIAQFELMRDVLLHSINNPHGRRSGRLPKPQLAIP